MESPVHRVPEIWTRIERVLKEQAPEVFATLAPPATSTELDPGFEQGIGRIVEHTHDDSMEETKTSSYADWLECVAVALEKGKFNREQYGFFRVHPQFAYTWSTSDDSKS